MPTSIENLDENDALRFARVAALDYRKSPLLSIDLLSDQGCFSLTFLASFEDKTDAIIQLRNTTIDLALVALARGLLGDIVPSLQIVECTSDISYIYAMPFIRGPRWNPLVETSIEEDAAVAGELGSILSKCIINMNGDAIVDNYIIPRLKNILAKDLLDPPLRMRITNLLNRVENLKRLPLMLCHIDPNPFNIILDESNLPHIIGLLDWEGVTLLPFGMNAYQIRLIAVINRQRIDYPDPKSATPIAMAFWNSLTANIEPELKGCVLDAMCTGLILLCEFCEGQSELELQNAVARLDWLEEMYRPLCG